MKLNAIIIKNPDSDTHTAFIQQFPGVCAQGDTIQDVQTNLSQCLKIFANDTNNLVSERHELTA